MSNFTAVPEVTIEIDGAPLAGEIAHAIREIRVAQLLSQPSQCEICLLDPHQSFLSTALTDVGRLIQVNVAPHTDPLFYGQITAVEYVYDPSSGPSVVVRSYDLLHQLRKRQPVRTHVQVNVQQLAQDLTKDLGITSRSRGTAPPEPRLFQYKQSDLQLLTELAEKYGYYFFLRHKELQVGPLETKPVAEPLRRGENLLQSRFSVNGETATVSVTATGWDLRRTVACCRTAQQSVRGVNVDTLIDPATLGSDGRRTIVDADLCDENQAEATAQQELDRHRLQMVTFWGVAEGNPALFPGTTVRISGVAASLEGCYVLTEVTHTIDPEKGFVTEVSSVPPTRVKIRPPKNATVGIVSQVNDPDNLGRVKVSLPTYNDIESEWLEVLAPGAGAGKGQLMLPDVGDQVLLLIVNGEPGQAVILGGIYGEKELPQTVVEDGAVVRFITQTAGEQRILLDDSDNTIAIETQNGHVIRIAPKQIEIVHDNGSHVDLADNRMTVHAATDLQIEAPGNAITFRARKIDFEEA